jgi:hypothetical protein
VLVVFLCSVAAGVGACCVSFEFICGTVMGRGIQTLLRDCMCVKGIGVRQSSQT